MRIAESVLGKNGWSVMLKSPTQTVEYAELFNLNVGKSVVTGSCVRG